MATQSDDEGAVASGGGRVPFSNRLLAFRALKQGLKYKYENWRMWNNYMVVALDVGESTTPRLRQ